jgi:uncharacterized phage-associated protein
MDNTTITVGTFVYQHFAGSEEDKISTLNMMYILHGYFLSILHKPLVHEPFEAWCLGPVISSMFHNWSEVASTSFKNHQLEPRMEEFVSIVLNIYKDWEPFELKTETHGPAWEDAFRKGHKLQIEESDIIKEWKTTKLEKIMIVESQWNSKKNERKIIYREKLNSLPNKLFE